MCRRIAGRLKDAIGYRSEAGQAMPSSHAAGTENPLAARFRLIDEAGLSEVRRSLELHYFGNDPRRLDTASGRRDLDIHLHARLDALRGSTIPWLNDASPLCGASVLEIGCGTGSGTVALAEQGANVIAVDIDEISLQVARDRCRVYGLDVPIVEANAMDVHDIFRGDRFDFILFTAALEHMTHEERIPAMQRTWNMLPDGNFWCVTESPNRLWYHDHHTSLLPFFHWLPDDLAFRYSRFSARSGFGELYADDESRANMLHFLRRGRGVSFHEFELAMMPADRLCIVSSKQDFLRERWASSRMAEHLTSTEHAFQSLLMRIGPQGIHRGFFERDLDLILRKN